MSNISQLPPSVNGGTYDDWSAAVRRLMDLETLALILGPVARTDALRSPGTCHDGTCPRCTLARIVAENQPMLAWSVYEAEERGVGMIFLGYVQAKTADEAKVTAREQMGRYRS